MIIAFTGTRKGITNLAANKLYDLMKEIKEKAAPDVPTLLHGGAIGADEEAHNIARALGYRISVYPCDIKSWQAQLSGEYGRFAERPPLERNRTMVDRANVLIVMPAEKTEQRRGGTWPTYRYGVEQMKERFLKIYLIYPDGTMARDRA